MKRKSKEIHHAFYGNDRLGISTFPVCKQCHDYVCHAAENWIKDVSDPVWKNRNTEAFWQRLQLGYQLLYAGVNV